VAHGQFLDAITAGQLEHLNQKELTDAVRASQQRPLAGAMAWDPKVAVDQGPLVAATLAVWQFARWVELSSPGAWTSKQARCALSQRRHHHQWYSR